MTEHTGATSAHDVEEAQKNAATSIENTTPSAELVKAAREDATRPLFIPFYLRVLAAWTWRLAVVGFGVWLLFRLLAPIASIVVIPLLVAVLLTALLNPVRLLLRRAKLPNMLATAVTILGFIAVVIALIGLVGQQLVAGFESLREQVMQGIDAVIAWLQTGPFGLDPGRLPELIDQGVQQISSALQNNSSAILGGTVSAASTAGTFVIGTVTMLFTLIFFLGDGQRIGRWLIGLLPTQARARAWGASVRGWETLTEYVKVQILVAFLDATGIALGAWLLGVPLVIPIGVLVFLGSFIPIVGAVVTGAVAVLVALVTVDFGTAIWMLVVVLLVQQLEGNVFQPLIMGKAVSVHPLAVVLSIAAFSTVFGIVGALLAVPAVAVTNRVVLYLTGNDSPSEQETPSPHPGGVPQSAGQMQGEGAGGSSHDPDDPSDIPTVEDLPANERTPSGSASDPGPGSASGSGQGASGESSSARPPRRARGGR